MGESRPHCSVVGDILTFDEDWASKNKCFHLIGARNISGSYFSTCSAGICISDLISHANRVHCKRYRRVSVGAFNGVHGMKVHANVYQFFSLLTIPFLFLRHLSHLFNGTHLHLCHSNHLYPEDLPRWPHAQTCAALAIAAHPFVLCVPLLREAAAFQSTPTPDDAARDSGRPRPQRMYRVRSRRILPAIRHLRAIGVQIASEFVRRSLGAAEWTGGQPQYRCPALSSPAGRYPAGCPYAGHTMRGRNVRSGAGSWLAPGCACLRPPLLPHLPRWDSPDHLHPAVRGTFHSGLRTEAMRRSLLGNERPSPQIEFCAGRRSLSERVVCRFRSIFLEVWLKIFWKQKLWRFYDICDLWSERCVLKG